MWFVDAILVFAILVIAAMFLSTGWFLALRLSSEAEQPETRRWLIQWTLKGFVAPFVIWVATNVGWTGTFLPRMLFLRYAGLTTGGWAFEFLVVLAIGTFAMATYWCALTLGWVLVLQARELDAEARAHFRGLCLTCFLGLLLPAIAIVWIGKWLCLGIAAGLMLLPMAGYAPGIMRRKPLPPMYARAIARIKFGKYSEAEWEIISELERHENDFDGWMMLAALYAEKFGDLREAEQTVMEICDQPGLNPSQLAVALHKLADWYLDLAGDPEAARRALGVICHRLPGSHLAHMAQQRIHNLPRTAEDLRDQKQHRPLPLPALSDSLDDDGPPPPPLVSREEATVQVNQLTERLRQNPDDVGVRERLARLLADSLGKADLAIEQMWLLMGVADQTRLKRAEWLGQIAAWQLRHRHDRETARRLLERLTVEYPESPQAFAAKRRLELMAQEDRHWRGAQNV